MPDSKQPIRQTIIRACSQILLWIGAAVFFIGGKFLYGVKHGSFLVSESIGILGGSLLMVLGAGVAIAGKSRGGTK